VKDYNYKIEPYTDNLKSQLLSVWEQSVKATHSFLAAKDFEEIKRDLSNFDFNLIHVHCLMAVSELVGFIGISERKIEMLFLSPKYFGHGLGKQLIEFAIEKYDINQVDVNEQNTSAIEFYKKIGFKTYARTEQDDQGRAYPILKMKLMK
jgi:putative acetyltransferase